MNEPVSTLAGLVIAFVLDQHRTWPIPLGDAAHDLALHQHRVDHGADCRPLTADIGECLCSVLLAEIFSATRMDCDNSR
jgi:hypothetical protein